MKRFLTPQKVTDRYDGAISVKTLANWRSAGTGPPYTKINGRIVYPLNELEVWEAARTVLVQVTNSAASSLPPILAAT